MASFYRYAEVKCSRATRSSVLSSRSWMCSGRTSKMDVAGFLLGSDQG